MYLLRTIYLDKTEFSTIKQTVRSDLGLSIFARLNSTQSFPIRKTILWYENVPPNMTTRFLIW